LTFFSVPSELKVTVPVLMGWGWKGWRERRIGRFIGPGVGGGLDEGEGDRPAAALAVIEIDGALEVGLPCRKSCRLQHSRYAMVALACRLAWMPKVVVACACPTGLSH
jgi:hypothetical protein